VDLRNIPSEDVRSLSLAHKILVSPQVLIGNVVFSLTVLQADRRPMNPEYKKNIFYHSSKFYSKTMEK